MLIMRSIVLGTVVAAATVDARRRHFQAKVSVRTIALVSLLLLAPLVAACNSTSDEAQPRGFGAAGEGRGGRGRGGRGSGVAVAVQTTTLRRISIPRLVELSGTLASPDQAKVSSEIAGVVREVTVELGSEVRPGTVLVRVQPRELELAVERAESALRQVEAQLGLSQSENKQPPADDQIASVRQAAANRDDARAAFARAQQLHGRGLLSQVDLDTSETRLKISEANHQASLDTAHSLKAALQDRRASYALAQKKLADADIKAPVGGAVSDRFVQPGEFIRENTPVVTIVQMNPLKLRTAVQEKNAALIKPGQEVAFIVEAFPGRTFNGKIAYVSPAVDQTTRTFAVEALVDNHDRQLKPGFFAKGTVRTRVDDDVLAVPENAVSTLAGVSSVYVIGDGKARQQQVTLGERQDKVIELLTGLKGDETLAASNLGQLATGTPVRVGQDEAGAPASSGGRRGAGRGRGRGRGSNGEGEQQ